MIEICEAINQISKKKLHEMYIIFENELFKSPRFFQVKV